MGLELVLSILEIKKGRRPAFKKAEKLLNSLSDSKCVEVYANKYDVGDDVPQISASNARQSLKEALFTVKKGWYGENGIMVVCNGIATTMLIAGDATWGDNVTECEDMFLFAVSGMAEAAGFLVGKNRTEYLKAQRMRNKKFLG
jgi:hypothetical protein